MVQEARSFNALFSTAKTAKASVGKGKHAHIITIKLRKVGFNAKGPSLKHPTTRTFVTWATAKWTASMRKTAALPTSTSIPR
jgi:hypothetical protein